MLLASFLILILCVRSFATLGKLGAMGDSLTDEYWDNGSSAVSTYATNWPQLVVMFRGINMGPTAAQDGTNTWGEPRNAGYKYNWARSGATSSTLLAQGQHTGLSNQASSERISYAVLANKTAGAINITASHNPGTDNGFKVRNEFGGAVDPDILTQIEAAPCVALVLPDEIEQPGRDELDINLRALRFKKALQMMISVALRGHGPELTDDHDFRFGLQPIYFDRLEFLAAAQKRFDD